MAGEFEKPYFASLVNALRQEKAAGVTIFPPGRQIFRAFDLTPMDKVKVVILGQDPYHERCQEGDQDHDPGKALKAFDVGGIRQKADIDLRTQSMGKPQAKHTQTRVQKHLHLNQYISFALEHG